MKGKKTEEEVQLSNLRMKKEKDRERVLCLKIEISVRG